MLRPSLAYIRNPSPARTNQPPTLSRPRRLVRSSEPGTEIPSTACSAKRAIASSRRSSLISSIKRSTVSVAPMTGKDSRPSWSGRFDRPRMRRDGGQRGSPVADAHVTGSRCGAALSFRARGRTVSTFSDLAAEFLAEYHAEHPVQASALGLAKYDDLLDDLSADAFERRRLSDDAWLTRLRGGDAATLTFDEAIDRDLLIASLTERAIYDEWEIWRRSPDTYMNPGLEGVFILFLHRLRPEPELVKSAIGRLRGMPAQLAEARTNLRPDLVPALLLKRAVNQARAGADYTRDLLPAQVDPANRDGLLAAGAEAGDALEAYADFLEEMEPNATGDWAFGEARYDAVLRDAELLGTTARELRERARGEIDSLTADMRATAQQISGHDDWHALVLELNHDRPADPEAMRVGYEDWTARARAFLRDKGLVSFPAGEECSVEPSPPFQRPVLAVASYQDPPPFSDSMRGHFFVPFPPDEASEAEIAKRLE